MGSQEMQTMKNVLLIFVNIIMPVKNNKKINKILQKMEK